jgi:hypothetical protein
VTLRNASYRPRLMDSRLELLLSAFAAVELVGTMWCGKTWMADTHAMIKISLAQKSSRAWPALPI